MSTAPDCSIVLDIKMAPAMISMGAMLTTKFLVEPDGTGDSLRLDCGLQKPSFDNDVGIDSMAVRERNPMYLAVSIALPPPSPGIHSTPGISAAIA